MIWMKKIIESLRLIPLSWLIIGFGILVRLVQYLSNRSLWADEAVLALNIVNRSYLELGQRLDYDQAAPLGFLWLEKFAVQLFGDNEYALRFFPLVMGIASIFLFAKFAQICLEGQNKDTLKGNAAQSIALVLFVCLSSLLDYSSEVKQYSTDVAVALVLWIVLLPKLEQKYTWLRTIFSSIIVFISVWFSHPAILVLGGLGFSELVVVLIGKNKHNWYKKLIIYLSGLLSFGFFYWFFVRALTSNETLNTSWQDAFPDSPFNLIWFLDAFGKFFYKPLGFESVLDGLAIFAFAIGCLAYFRRNKIILLGLLSPLFVTFIGAGLKIYPFRSRLVLFLAPLFLILIAQGAAYLLQYKQQKIVSWLGIVLTVLLIIVPLFEAKDYLIQPRQKEEIRPVISYIKNNQQPEDILYIYQRGIYQFQYYADKYGYQEGDYIIGVDDLDEYDGKKLSEQELQRYKADLDKLRGNKRVWFLFSHANIGAENRAIKEYLDRIGKHVDTFGTYGSFVYLYDLR